MGFGVGGRAIDLGHPFLWEYSTGGHCVARFQDGAPIEKGGPCSHRPPSQFVRYGASLPLPGQRPDQHDHLAAFHLGKVFHFAVRFGVLGDTLKQFTAQVLVGHFTATEA